VMVTQSASKGDDVAVTDSSANGSLAGIGYALASAVCIALVFWQFGTLSERSATFWPMLPLRICAVIGSGLLLILSKPPLPIQKTSVGTRRSLGLMVIMVASFNCLAWFSFNAALELTSTTIAAALSSLFAAVTIFMARLFLKEHLARIQWAGVAVILLGVLLVSL
jgi:drug/metabolite transporter (DMT)-like permease